MIKNNYRSIFQTRITLRILAFSILIFFTTACNYPFIQSASSPDFLDNDASAQVLSDKDALPYRMYFDSSADPALNELQTRRFIGHLHLAEIEDIFGDIQSLPLDDNCNYYGGPVLDEGLIWYVTVTPDLVGVNLVSVSPDGAMSSAFDLDGDRDAEIVDILLADNRRISFVAENNGMDVFASWLRGLDPFCNTELVEQLDLPNLGCDETGDGSSGGGVGTGWGGITNPMDMLCSQYDTGPGAGLMDGGIRGHGTHRVEILPGEWIGPVPGSYRVLRLVDTYVEVDDYTGQTVGVTKVITDIEAAWPAGRDPRTLQITRETVGPDGRGTRSTQRYNPDGTPDGPPVTENFTVHPDDVGGNYDVEGTNPPPPPPPPNPYEGSTESNPGPEGDDSNVAEFCRNRANYRSGVEQAADEDPTSMSVSCRDLVADPDMPDDPNCMIMDWARPDDILGALQSSGDNAGCDPLNTPDGAYCEPTDWKEKLRGLAAEFRSLQLEEIIICPPTVCNPGDNSVENVENPVFIKGEIEISCPVLTEPPMLEPSEENCPPGTYYAPVTDRCIDIQIPQGGGDGGSERGGGCNLSVSACTSQGKSFDSNKCECVDIQ